MVSVGELAGLGMAIVVVSIVIGLGSEIVLQMRATDTRTVNVTLSTIQPSDFYNATTNGLKGLNTFSTWIPLVSLVVVASVIIGLVVNYMGRVA